MVSLPCLEMSWNIFMWPSLYPYCSAFWTHLTQLCYLLMDLSPWPPCPPPVLITAKTMKFGACLYGVPSQTRWPRAYGPTWKLCLRGGLPGCHRPSNFPRKLGLLYFPPGLCLKPCRKCSNPMYWKFTVETACICSFGTSFSLVVCVEILISYLPPKNQMLLQQN
jgi:hypothetical protein